MSRRRVQFPVSDNDIGLWGVDRDTAALFYAGKMEECLHQASDDVDKARELWYGQGLGGQFDKALKSYREGAHLVDRSAEPNQGDGTFIHNPQLRL